MKRDVRNVYLSKVTRTIVGNIEHRTRGVKLMSNHGKQEVSVTPSEWDCKRRNGARWTVDAAALAEPADGWTRDISKDALGLLS